MLTTQIAQVGAETTLKLPAEISQLEAQTALLNFDLTTVKPAEVENLQAQGLLLNSQKTVQDKQAEQLTAQTTQVEAQSALLAYDLNNIKPVELANLGFTGLGITADTANKTQVTANLVLEGDNIVKQGNLLNSQKTVQDKQAEQLTAETNKIDYENVYKLPEEVKVLQFTQDQLTAQIGKISADTIATAKQGELTDAQVCQVKAQANQINAEVALKLPEEIEILKRNQIQLTAQTGEIDYRVATLLPSQTAQNTAQTAQITYTTSSVLPSQVSLTNAQTDSATAQTALYNQKTVTELAQTTTTPASGSVMGVQNDLMATQKASYLRDAEQKAAKMLIDTWNVRRNADPTSNPVSATNRLRDEDIGSAVDKMLDGIGAV